ncbi:MAG: nicotinate-nucleotide--dimethylbenzimidazole phosphoribosyltransferase [Bryobacteraceae bacterium]
MNGSTNIPPRANPGIRRAVEERWNLLTKPPGSLGRLEILIADLAEMQGTSKPKLDRKSMYIFCGDHGVTAEGVSAWPSEVTAQMVRNFVRGGAAISVLGESLSIDLTIVDCGVLGPAIPGTLDRKIATGTRNFTREPAMTRAEAMQALNNGAALARECKADIVGIGEMGIGNTASASALACAFTGMTPTETVGRGAGISDEGLTKKRDAVERGLALHHAAFPDPIDTLAVLGGFEIATMTGFLLECAAQRRPVVIDGFITTAAVLAAKAMAPNVADYLFYSHCSAEQAHRRVLDLLNADPILDLGMRLGEGSGAALAMGLLSQAYALYENMATFEQASVAEAQQ